MFDYYVKYIINNIEKTTIVILDDFYSDFIEDFILDKLEDLEGTVMFGAPPATIIRPITPPPLRWEYSQSVHPRKCGTRYRHYRSPHSRW